MAFVAKGGDFPGHHCCGYRQVHKSLTAANMKAWRAAKLPPLEVTTRDLGVDTQWAAWHCPAQHKLARAGHDASACARTTSTQQNGSLSRAIVTV
eukprot:3939490-Amphidinium_carterae.1